MDVSRLTSGVGVAAALATVALLGVPPAVVFAGVAGAVAVLAADGGTEGLAVGSLALAAASVLVAYGLASAATAVGALAALFSTIGLAGCLVAALADEAPTIAGRYPTTGRYSRGRTAGLLGAWTALVVPAASVLALRTVTAQPFGSLLGARLGGLEYSLFFLAVPGAVAAAAAWAGVSSWREAGLPPVVSIVAPPALLVGWAVAFLPATVEFDALSVGDLAGAPVAYVLVWSTTTVVAASAVAGAVAAEDPAFRRGPPWLAVAAGPLAIGALVAAGHGGVFVTVAVTTVPPGAEWLGAIVDTADRPDAAAFLVALTVAALAFAVALPARAPGVRRLTAGRPAGVGVACLLVAVALSGLPTGPTVVAGSFAVLAWALLTSGAAVEPPPRTALTRAVVATGTVVVGSLVAMVLVDVVPRSDPGLGGALLLTGVAILALAIRRPSGSASRRTPP